MTAEDVVRMAAGYVDSDGKKWRAFLVKSKDYRTYGYIVTGFGSILYVEDHALAGITVGYQYPASREHGQGVQTVGGMFEGVREVDMEDLKISARKGINYTFEHGIRRYSGFDEWYENYWNKDSIEEVFSNV